MGLLVIREGARVGDLVGKVGALVVGLAVGGRVSEGATEQPVVSWPLR